MVMDRESIPSTHCGKNARAVAQKMDDLENEVNYDCPHCGEELLLMVDPSGGDSQSFTTDCEVCCHPISINFTLGEDGVEEFSAEKES